MAHLPKQSQALGLGKGLGNEGRLLDSIAIGGIEFAFADRVPPNNADSDTESALVLFGGRTA